MENHLDLFIFIFFVKPSNLTLYEFEVFGKKCKKETIWKRDSKPQLPIHFIHHYKFSINAQTQFIYGDLN